MALSSISSSTWLIIGVVLGVVTTGALVYLWTQTRRPKPLTTITATWRLGDLTDPILVVRDLGAIDVPNGTRILASGLVDSAIQTRCVVRRVENVPAEFAIDAHRKRAVLFLGGAQAGALAAQTVDPAMLDRLDRDARSLWERAGAYVEHHPIASLAGRSGITVETTGRARDAVPYQSRYMLSLEDGGAVIGVLVDRDPEPLRGEMLQVRGNLVRDARGYSAIEAVDLRRIR